MDVGLQNYAVSDSSTP